MISDKLEMRITSGGGRALFTREDIEPGELIIQVPCSLCIMSDESGTSEEPIVDLAIKLLLEGARSNAPSGIFANYYATLPRYIDVPFAWEVDDLIGLAPHHRLLIHLAKRKNSLMKGYVSLRRTPGLEDVSWDDYLWATSVIGSRIFKRDEARCCMVPFMDLMDHDPTYGALTCYGVGDEGATTSCVSKKILAGQQIFLTYGPLSNDKLLHKYAFALVTNEEDNGYCLDEATFVMSLPTNDTFKMSLFNAAKISNLNGTMTMTTTYIRDVPHWFSVLRLMAATGEDVAKLQAMGMMSAHDVKFISADNEVHMFYLVFSYTCNGCARLEAQHESGRYKQCFRLVVSAVKHLLLKGSDIAGTQLEAEVPVICGIVRESFNRAGVTSSPAEQLDFERRAREVAKDICSGSDANKISDRPITTTERAARTAQRAEFCRRVLHTEQRLLSHFVTLTSVCTAVLEMTTAEREQILPTFEDAIPLKGLTPTSRNLIARYARGLCRAEAMRTLGHQS